MSDAVYVLFAAGFFAATLLLAALCDFLSKGDKP